MADGTSGNDTFAGTAGDDFYNGLAGTDTINGGDGNDTLTGGEGHDSVRGEAGNDSLFAGLDDDYLVGGAGDDTLDGGLGIDRVAYGGSAVNVDLNIQDGSAQNTGQGMDVLLGIEHVTGSALADTLTGNGNDNWLWGAGGADSIAGGDGNDLVSIGKADATVAGGSGIDTLSFYSITLDGPVSVSLESSSPQNTGQGTITLSGFENLSGVMDANDTLTGSAVDNVLAGWSGGDLLVGAGGNDTLLGDGVILIDEHGLGLSGPITTFDEDEGGGNDTLDGGPGDDLLHGGAGIDTATYASTSGNIVVDLAAGTATGAAGNDTLVSIEAVVGGSGDDLIYGATGNETLTGGAGDDVMWGGAGDDRLDGGSNNGVHDFEFGVGGDGAAYTYATGAVTVSLAVSGAQTVGGGMGVDTLLNIEALYGGQYNDVLTGDAQQNYLWGSAGADTLSGGGEADIVEGGAGNDRLDGGDGFDSAAYSTATSGVTVSLATGQATGGGLGTDTLVSIERVAGSDFGDTLTGDASVNHLDGWGGNDNINGGGGADDLSGDAGDDTLNGGVGNDVLAGGDGNDLLTANGGQGADTLQGGDGNDVLSAVNLTSNGTPIVGDFTGTIFDGGSGTDYLGIGGVVNFLGELEDMEGIAFQPAFSGTVNGTNIVIASPVLVMKASEFDFNYNGDGVTVRGTGHIHLNVDPADAEVLDLSGMVFETGASVTVFIQASDDHDTVSGSSTHEDIQTGEGNDVINAGGGDDYVQAGAALGQVTTITLGAGRDTVEPAVDMAGTITITDFTVGASGDEMDLEDFLEANADGYVEGSNPFATGYLRLVQSGSNTVLEFDADGGGNSFANLVQFSNTTAASFTAENLDGFAPSGGSSSNDSITGTTDADSLSGDVGNDTIQGGDGADTLSGGTGADSLSGGAGADSLSGDAGADTLNGGSGNDHLHGGDDNDVLQTGANAGNDTLSGGAGNDTLSATNLTFNGTPLFGTYVGSSFQGGAGNDYLSIGGEVNFQADMDSIEGISFQPAFSGTTNGASVIIAPARLIMTSDDFDFEYAGSAVTLRGVGDIIINVDPTDAEALDLSGTVFETGANVSFLVIGSDDADTVTGTSRGDDLHTGEGNDVINMGGGDDYVHAGAGLGETTLITLGAGRDVVEPSEDLAGSITITDFTVGSAGDELDLEEFLTANATGLVSGTDPFAAGYVRLVQSGADTLLEFDANGGADNFATLVRFSNTTATAFVAANLNGLTPSGTSQNASGGSGNDTYQGGTGHDTYTGLAGHDTINGGGGGDSLDGGAGHDFVRGEAGADTLVGGLDDDYLVGGDGNDRLDGGVGIDRVSFGGAATGVTVNLTISGSQTTGQGSDVLVDIEHVTGTTFGDTLTGNTDDNWLWGAGGADSLSGGDGHDLISIGKGNSTVAGGADNDTLSFYSNTLTGPVNVSLAVATAQNTGQGLVTLSGFENLVGVMDAGDTLTGSTGDNVLAGWSGADSLSGDDGNDLLLGDGYINIDSHGLGGSGAITTVENDGSGNDTIDGGAGNDTLKGGAGADQLTGGAGADRIEGGDGVDRALYTTASGAVTVNLTTGLATGAAGSDTLSDVEDLTGSAFGDDLTGSAGANNLVAGGGNDVVYGGDGNDQLSGDAGDDQLFGEVGNDTLTGGTDDDYLGGGAGDDRLDGGANNGVHAFQFGVGGDGAGYFEATGAVTVNLGATGAQDVGGGMGRDTLINIENVYGSTYNDVLTGNSGENFLWGSSGDDSLNGASGNDIVEGGLGDDLLQGGGGFDSVAYSTATAGVTVSLAITTGQAVGGGLGTDTLASIERLAGSDYGDTLSGDANVNDIDGWDGADSIAGGAGADTLGGDDGADTIVADGGADVISGGAGVDKIVLSAAAGAVTVTDFATGAGGDALDYNALLDDRSDWDTVENPFESGHLRFMQDGTSTLLQLNADGAGGDYTTIATLQNTSSLLFVTGNLGYAPVPQVIGGTGGDTFALDVATFTPGTPGESLEVDGGGGVDTVEIVAPPLAPGDNATITTDGTNLLLDLDGDGITDLTITNVEEIVLNGERVVLDGDFSGTGLAPNTIHYEGTALDNLFDAESMSSPESIDAQGFGGADTLIGANADDVLDGGDGADSLVGRGDNDTLEGGLGNDTLVGGDGTDTAVFSGDSSDYDIVVNGTDIVVTGADGVDELSDIELLQFDDGTFGENHAPSASNVTTSAIINGSRVFSLNSFGFTDPDGDGLGAVTIVTGPVTGTLRLDGVLVTDGQVISGDDIAAGKLVYAAPATTGSASFTFRVQDDGLEDWGDNTAAATNTLTINVTNAAAGGGGGGGGTPPITSGTTGTVGDDVATFSAGDDSFTAGSGADSVSGGGGQDWLQGNAGNDTLSAGVGDDVVYGGRDDDRVAGDEGNDTLYGDQGEDTVSGGVGDDRAFGGLGNDRVEDTAGSNYLRGEDGDDVVVGGSGFDDAHGNAGNDTVSGGLGDDWVVGGQDNDTLWGDEGGDIVYGNMGSDIVDGGAGADIVRGGQGNDVVRGGDGADYVSGDLGDDTVTGGTGADLFHTWGGAGIDRVTDFLVADGDRVFVDPGTTWTTAQVGSDVVITMGGGGQMILVGVQLSTLADGWIFGA